MPAGGNPAAIPRVIPCRGPATEGGPEGETTDRMEVVEIGSVGSAELELVERHRHGDTEAFEEIYGRFESMVYGVAVRIVGLEDAADVTQEIFVRVYRHLPGFRGRSTLKTWIYRVALNCCRSRMRRRRWSHQPLAEESGDAPGHVLEDPRPGPEQKAAGREAGRTLRAALDELPRVFREAVVLRDVEGLAYDEIAQITGVRIGTVRSRIARGRERLRRRLEDES